MHAQHDIVTANPSVSLSVRPSQSGIVSKLMYISSNFFHLLIGAWHCSWSATTISKFQGESCQRRR